MKIKIQNLFLGLLLLAATVVSCQSNYQVEHTDNQVVIENKAGDNLRITAYTNRLVEVSFYNDSIPLIDSSHSVIAQAQHIQTQLHQEADFVEFQTADLKLHIDVNPFKIKYIYKKDTLLSELGFVQRGDSARGFRYQLDGDESIYGAGERAIEFDRRGYRLNLYNEPHYNYSTQAANLNYSIPLVLSSKRYAILFDNAQKGYVDIAKTEENILEFAAIGGRMSYYFMLADSFANLLSDYSQLTGYQPIPPRWALGNFASRFGYKSEAEARSIVEKMQADSFPLDAIILDLYWFGKGVHEKFFMGNLTWDKENWANPQKMISDFKAKGIKTILITEPFILKESFNFETTAKQNLLATDSAGKPFIIKEFWFGHTGLLDIFKPETQAWFWQKYKKQIDIGVAAWWGDLGEPEKHPAALQHVNGNADEVHNIYGHYWDKMLFEKYREEYPDTRLFNLNRSGFAGSQRYSVFPWSGDVERSWNGLKAQLPIMLGMSMCGIPYMHSDLGGFAIGDRDNELYIRWLQFGAFTPIFRPHGSNVPSEPVFYDKKTKDIVRRFIKLRYQMLPYNYTLAWKNSTNGMPLAYPLIFEEPDNEAVRNIDDTYFWGTAFLVAPILEKEQQKRKLFLPKGKWFNFWNDKQYTGNQWITTDLELETIPVFVKAGSLIPLIPTLYNTNNYSSENLLLHYYSDISVEKSAYTMYEDDGLTFGAYQQKNYELLHFGGKTTKAAISVNFSRSESRYKGSPQERKIHLIVHNIKHLPVIARLNKKNNYQITTQKQAFAASKNLAFWDKEKQTLEAYIFWKNDDVNFTIEMTK